jgi:hypothetical protein
VLEALLRAEILGYDKRGNRMVRITVDAARLTVVIDEARRAVITIWEG